jgi:hypothetical protein
MDLAYKTIKHWSLKTSFLRYFCYIVHNIRSLVVLKSNIYIVLVTDQKKLNGYNGPLSFCAVPYLYLRALAPSISCLFKICPFHTGTVSFQLRKKRYPFTVKITVTSFSLLVPSKIEMVTSFPFLVPQKHCNGYIVPVTCAPKTL